MSADADGQQDRATAATGSARHVLTVACALTACAAGRTARRGPRVGGPRARVCAAERATHRSAGRSPRVAGAAAAGGSARGTAPRRPSHGGHATADAGRPARVVMQILGHSQIGLTLGTYSHVVSELAEEAAERMGAVLWS